MRNALKFIMAGALIAGMVQAQEKSTSVDSVLKELSTHQGKAAPAVVPPVAVVAPAAVVPPVAVVAPVAVKAAPAPAPVAAVKVAPAQTPAPVTATAQVAAPVAVKEGLSAEAVKALDVPATLEASRDLYAGGEFEQAQKGFAAVIQKDPENVMARIYLRRILERDHRDVEVSAMKDLSGAWKTGLVLRSYDISAEAAEKIGFGKDADAVDAAGKFREVKFPAGASAVYQAKTGQLFVRNTRENLAVIEQILKAMDVAKSSAGTDQVEIEAKFVEVSEGTLEQLGFEWNFANPIPLGDNVKATDGAGLFANTLRGGSQSPALPFTQPLSMGAETSADYGDWKAFRFEDTFFDGQSANQQSARMRVHNAGSRPFDVLISALDQSSGTDVLSAPRVVTWSDKKATIRAGQLHYFPKTYEVGGNEGTIVHVKYDGFEEKLLGVELDVTPKVDGDQITLSLNPKVSELISWQTYRIAPANSAYSYYQLGINQQFEHDAITARLPIFKRREVKTQVTIADGATMGMGGLINERIEKFEDKVPFLGSLPLVGRLFRSEGERAVKRNLMIFVTAKKIEPNGRINTERSFE
ncbi:MAG: type II secretion system protein GspD [Kiritimatiellaceae bacterium]|nr:type II secretion system protein GspD [Kiritimatiellaceae bacterium]